MKKSKVVCFVGTISHTSQSAPLAKAQPDAVLYGDKKWLGKTLPDIIGGSPVLYSLVGNFVISESVTYPHFQGKLIALSTDFDIQDNISITSKVCLIENNLEYCEVLRQQVLNWVNKLKEEHNH